MTKRPNVSQTLALKAAAAAVQADPHTAELDGQAEGRSDMCRPARGRPRGKRPVAARQTAYYLHGATSGTAGRLSMELPKGPKTTAPQAVEPELVETEPSELEEAAENETTAAAEPAEVGAET